MGAASIDGHTQLVGLIGWPVEHSLSPTMHNAAFDALGLNWRYVPLPVPPGRVEMAVRGLTALSLRGANVTVPHKQAAMAPLDVVAPEARALGAVNTIVVSREEEESTALSGHNTDAKGFVEALRGGEFEPGGGSVVVVGAGGAARAVVYGLLKADVEEIAVLNRTPERARTLASTFRRQARASSQLRALPLTPETLLDSARAADLLVNATPVGMWPDTDDSIWPEDAPVPSHLAVFDLVYNPQKTRLLQQAKQSGARPIGGLGMLVRQGALAFEMWTGEEAPVEVMRSACLRGLRTRS